MDPMYIINWNATFRWTWSISDPCDTGRRLSESEDNTAMNPLLRYGRPGDVRSVMNPCKGQIIATSHEFSPQMVV